MSDLSTIQRRKQLEFNYTLGEAFKKQVKLLTRQETLLQFLGDISNVNIIVAIDCTDQSCVFKITSTSNQESRCKWSSLCREFGDYGDIISAVDDALMRSMVIIMGNTIKDEYEFIKLVSGRRWDALEHFELGFKVISPEDVFSD